jgi:hypothetical protein
MRKSLGLILRSVMKPGRRGKPRRTDSLSHSLTHTLLAERQLQSDWLCLEATSLTITWGCAMVYVRKRTTSHGLCMNNKLQPQPSVQHIYINGLLLSNCTANVTYLHISDYSTCFGYLLQPSSGSTDVQRIIYTYIYIYIYDIVHSLLTYRERTYQHIFTLFFMWPYNWNLILIYLNI